MHTEIRYKLIILDNSLVQANCLFKLVCAVCYLESAGLFAFLLVLLNFSDSSELCLFFCFYLPICSDL